MSNKESYVTSFAAKVRAIYLALVDNNAAIAYFFEYQLTNPSLSMNMKSEVDFRLYLSSAQSKFEYPSTNSFFWPP